MARKTGEPLKQNLLLLFVVVCVALVGLTWVEGLIEPQEKTPAAARGVPTAAGPTSAVTLPPTSTTKEHKNDDHSVPAETVTPSPAPATPTAPPATPDLFDVTEDQ